MSALAGCAASDGQATTTASGASTITAPQAAQSPTPYPSTPATAPIEAPVTPSAPDEIDLLAIWTNGETVPELQWLADALGLEAILQPKQPYRNSGFIGVAPVGLRCMVTFDDGAIDPSEYGVLLWSRAAAANILHEGWMGSEDAARMIENYAFVCSPSG